MFLMEGKVWSGKISLTFSWVVVLGGKSSFNRDSSNMIFLTFEMMLLLLLAILPSS